MIATVSDVREWKENPPNRASEQVVGFEVQLWNAVNKTMEHSWKVGDGYTATDIVFSPDGQYIAVCSGLILYRTNITIEEAMRDKYSRILVWNVKTGGEVQRFEVQGDVPQSLSYSPDGKFLFCDCNSQDVVSWNVTTGKAAKVYDRLPPYNPLKDINFDGPKFGKSPNR